jgi:molybdate transport system substrate-binding protein
MPVTLNLLCAGAAQGLVTRLAPRLTAELDAVTGGRFGAVGAMREAFEADEPCDVFVSTQAIVEQMTAAGQLRSGSAAPLGRVYTGVAVRTADANPDVATPQALAAALSAADAVYFPDPARATAGIHFAKVLRELGLWEALQARLKTYPNGATAMRELAAASSARPIGCTQVTEILNTPGARLVALLPREFELATVYTAAVASRSADPTRAAQLVAMMAGETSAPLRRDCGFEA